jgi:hypothetical protein
MTATSGSLRRSMSGLGVVAPPLSHETPRSAEAPLPPQAQLPAATAPPAATVLRPEAPPESGRPSSAPAVGHRAGWAADWASIAASGPCLPILFDECGMAFVGLTAAADAGAPASSWRSVQLDAPDLAGLARAWLDQLVRESSDPRVEVVDVAVDRIAPIWADGGWRLLGRVGLRRVFGEQGPTRHLSSASSSVRIEGHERIWALYAEIDAGARPPGVDDGQPPAGETSIRGADIAAQPAPGTSQSRSEAAPARRSGVSWGAARGRAGTISGASTRPSTSGTSRPSRYRRAGSRSTR